MRNPLKTLLNTLNQLLLFNKKLFALSICILLCINVNAQNKFKEKTYFRGYVKDLRTAYLFDGFKNISIENRVHNRLKFEWYINDKFTFDIEVRNQFIYGDFVRNFNQISTVFTDLLGENSFNSYGSQLSANNNLLDFNFLIAENTSATLISQIDRLWIKWQHNKWEIQLGKQRINWGNNFVWNANDLFNTQSFLDFDYEERPGTDALRITYYRDYASRIEFAYAPQQKFQESTLALLYQFNKKDYDFQGILSYFKNQISVGFGWAGNIKNAGFKGEISYFEPIASASVYKRNVVGSIGFDYSLQNGWFFQTEFLYNGYGSTNNSISDQLFSTNTLSPQNIWFGKYAFAFASNYSFNPRLSFLGSVILNPSEINPKAWSVFLVPSIQLTLSEDFDLLFNAQLSFPNDLDLLSLQGNDLNPPDIDTFLSSLGLAENAILTSDKLIGTLSTRIRWSF